MQQKIALAFEFILATLPYMTESHTPNSIKQRAYAARVSVNALMKRAGVSNSTLWRWENEFREPHPITLGKVLDALEAIERERAV